MPPKGMLVLITLSLAFGETWRLPTLTATSYQFVIFPFFTVLIASWLAGEQVNLAFAAGAAPLVLVGVWIGAFLRTDRGPALPTLAGVPSAETN